MLKAARPNAERRRGGYSLIELLIVVALLGILSSMMISRFEPSVHEQLLGTGQVISADLSYARNLAVSQGSRYSVTFSASTHSWTLRHTGTNSLLDVLPVSPYRPAGATPDEQTTWLDELPRIGPGVEFVGISRGTGGVAASGTVEFDALGGLTDLEEVTLWLACGEQTSRRYLPIHIAPVTGIISLGDVQGAVPN